MRLGATLQRSCSLLSKAWRSPTLKGRQLRTRRSTIQSREAWSFECHAR